MKKIILSLSFFSFLLTSCNTQESEGLEGETTITKGEDRTDLTSEVNTENNMKEQGEEFLKEMEAKEGVTKTASGLLYEIVKEGEGENPIASNTVKVNYTG